MRLRNAIKARSREALAVALRVMDATLVLAVGLGAFWMRHDLVAPSPLQSGLLTIAPLMVSAAFSLTGCYAPRHCLNIAHSLKGIVFGGALAVLFLLILGYITKTTDEYSRVWLGLWAVMLPPMLIGERLAVRWGVARLGAAGVMRRRIALIGTPSVLDRLSARILNNSVPLQLDVAFTVALADESDATLSQALDAVAAHCAEDGVPDDFVLAFPGDQTALLERVVSGIRHYWANIDLCPDHAFIGLPFRDVRTIGGVPMLRLVTRPFEGWQGVVKWLEDKVLALVILLPALPLMALIALAIKLDSRGPVLFRQQRFGFGNHQISVLKFRTMFVEHCDSGQRQATRTDPRVTRLGRFLRSTSLDELPQLFNVLSGSMSLVGPRPHAVPHNLEFTPLVQDYLSRHRIKPGMTGWAQVNGFRGEITDINHLRKRVEHDLFYIENWSLELDLIIIARTLLLVLRDKSAY